MGRGSIGRRSYFSQLLLKRVQGGVVSWSLEKVFVSTGKVIPPWKGVCEDRADEGSEGGFSGVLKGFGGGALESYLHCKGRAIFQKGEGRDFFGKKGEAGRPPSLEKKKAVVFKEYFD